MAHNADIGVMQINWYWHRKGFKYDPVKMLDPAEQVKYIQANMAPNMAKRCSVDSWVGCYHNPSNKKRASNYQSKVQEKCSTFNYDTSSLYETYFGKNAQESKDKLPVVKKKDFYLTYRNLVKMQVPSDNLEEYIAKEKIKKIDLNLRVTNDPKLDLFNT